MVELDWRVEIEMASYEREREAENKSPKPKLIVGIGQNAKYLDT